MISPNNVARCELCGMNPEDESPQRSVEICPDCQAVEACVRTHPEVVQRLWRKYHQHEPILPDMPPLATGESEVELPEVLDGKRYRTIDRDRNTWYLSVSEVGGRPVEVFASTAFDRDHELQSRISNLTTITRLISLILRHISLGEPLTFDKCLKQIQRSSRQKNDLPDMLYGILSRYHAPRR